MGNKENGCNGNYFNCNENRKIELGLLPIEVQAKVWASMHRMEQIAENAADIVSDFEEWSATMNEIETLSVDCKANRAAILEKLFVAAEHFDSRREPADTPNGQIPYCKERAKEFDWLRHVFMSGTELFSVAVRIIRRTLSFNFEIEDLKLFKRDKEFIAIYDYWRAVNNSLITDFCEDCEDI